MKFEILYAGTQEELENEIAEREADGWETRGGITILTPKWSGPGPEFVYFSQIVVLEHDGIEHGMEDVMPVML